MAFQHIVQPFGNFEKHIFENEQGDAFEMTSQYGSCLLDLRFAGQSVLDGYKTPDDLVANAWAKNVFLLPYPNRLRDGQYVFGGKTYQFEINNADTQNSIHGFGKNVPMTVKKVETNDQMAKIHCTWQHDGSHPAYPFRFTFSVIMTLKNSDFEIELRFKNDDEQAIPVGLGWHPYFIMSEKVDDTSLQMPDSQLIVIDERMLPTGEKQDYSAFKNLTKIGSTSLDNGFFITEKGEKASVILQSERGHLHYWQEIGAAKWNFVQIFTPPHRQSIAVEPMTCNIDAFNNQDGLVLLTPKATLEGKFGVQFSK
ncbi:MAG: aldose 1-epimerase [Saprospiraceae bacterium]|nr:aldose 1-epimerase [Saprospiraceae bacterium]